MLLAMRIAPENVIIRGGVEIYLDIVLAVVEQLCCGIAGIVVKARSGWRWVKRRVEQGLCYRINRFHSRDVVVENRSVPVLRVIKLVSWVVTNPPIKALRTDVSKVPGPLCCRKYIEGLSRGGVIETLSLIVEEEKQLVLEDRPTDCASEHVPAEWCPNKRLALLSNSVKSIFPGIRVQLVIAEILPEITVETVGTRLDCGTDNATLEITEFSRGIVCDQVKFLNSVRRGCVTQKIIRYLVIVHSIEEEVIGLLTIAVDVRSRPVRRIVSIIKISGIGRDGTRREQC